MAPPVAGVAAVVVREVTDVGRVVEDRGNVVATVTAVGEGAAVVADGWDEGTPVVAEVATGEVVPVTEGTLELQLTAPKATTSARPQIRRFTA